MGESIAEQLAQARVGRLEKSWQSWAPRNPHASDLGDCRRYQVMRLVAWQVRQRPDARGLERMENGRIMEEAMIRQLQDEGFEVIELQAPFEIFQPVRGRKRRILSGRIDGKLRVGSKLVVFDVKDTTEYVLHGVDSEADLLTYSQWTRKWWRQMQAYMIGEEYDAGLLILGHRGERKTISLSLDYAKAEEILQLCAWAVELTEDLIDEGVDDQKVDEALAAREVPYHSDFAVCRTCPFYHRSCFPPEPATQSVQIREDLADVVRQYLVAQQASKGKDRLYRAIKEATEGFPYTVAGDYVIEGTVKVRNMKEQPAKPAHRKEYWNVEVRKAGSRDKARAEESS